MAISEQVERMEREELEDFAISLYEELQGRLNEVEEIARDAHDTATDNEDRLDDVEKTAEIAQSTAFELEDAVGGDRPSVTTQEIANNHGSVIDRVDALERGEVDASDIIDVDGSDNVLPIQRATDARKNNTHDFEGNKYRATFIWPTFANRAQSSNGKLILQSWQVKNILDENNLDTNNNTVRRTMQFVAKLSKRVDEDEDDPDFDPKDDANLVKFNDDGAKNTLVADKDEWMEFFDEQVDAAFSSGEDDDSSSEETTADDATHNVDEDVDGLMAASAVTSSSDDDLEDEAGMEVMH